MTEINNVTKHALCSKNRSNFENKHSLLKLLFQTFFELEKTLEICSKTRSGDPYTVDLTGCLIDQQTMYMRLATSLPATTLEDAFFKFAMWRADAPDLCAVDSQLSRYDEVALSAFEDFRRLLNISPADLPADFSENSQLRECPI